MSCSPLSLQKHQNQSNHANEDEITHESMRLQRNTTCLLNATLLTTTHPYCNQTPTSFLNSCMFCMNRTMQQSKALHLNLC